MQERYSIQNNYPRKYTALYFRHSSPNEICSITLKNKHVISFIANMQHWLYIICCKSKLPESNLTPPLVPLSPLPLPPPLLLPPHLPLHLPVGGRLLLPLPPAQHPAPLPADLHRANPPEVFRLPLPPEEDRLVPVFLREPPVSKNIIQ
jgi:hypothetical protein